MLPAILAGIGSAATNPWVLSAVGSILPSVVNALMSSPTEEEAKAKVMPMRQSMVDKLVQSGVDHAAAEQQADEAIGKEVKKAMAGGNGMPGWMEAALAIAGGVAGHKAGTLLRGVGKAGEVIAGTAAKAAAPAAKAAEVALPVAPVTKAAQAAAPEIDEAAKTLTSPYVKPIRDPNAQMTGGTQTNQRTLGPEDMPTSDLEIKSPYVRPREQIDPLTGAPRSSNGPMDPTTGAPREPGFPVEKRPDVNMYERIDPMAEIGEEAIEGPFVRSSRAPTDPYTGGRSMGAEDVSRRRALEEVDAVAAADKERQMNAMRQYDEVQRNRGKN